MAKFIILTVSTAAFEEKHERESKLLRVKIVEKLRNEITDWYR